MTKTLQEIHLEAEKEIDKKRLTIHLHSQAYVEFTEFLRRAGRRDSVDGTYANIGSGGIWSLNGIYAQVHLEQHERFSDVTPILDWFLDHGWKEVGQSEDASWGSTTIGYREVKFTKEAPPPLYWSHHELPTQSLYATVRMWPHPDSQVCVREQVGVEPTYRIVCKDV